MKLSADKVLIGICIIFFIICLIYFYNKDFIYAVTFIGLTAAYCLFGFIRGRSKKKK